MKQATYKHACRNAVLMAAVGLLGTTVAQATPVAGTIYAVPATDPRGAGTTIDYWKFTLAADAPNFSIDIRANESYAGTAFGGPPGAYVDLNGDGEITLADTQFRVFQASSTPFTTGSEYGTNDDNGYTFSTGLGWTDGSILSRDSYLRGYFGAGTYIIAMADYQITAAEAVAGFNKDDALTALGVPPAGQDHFDYQLTLATDYTNPAGTGITPNQIAAPSAVPVPAAVWLFGSALLGLTGFKRREMKTPAFSGLAA
jgi:hypothetical protein